MAWIAGQQRRVLQGKCWTWSPLALAQDFVSNGGSMACADGAAARFHPQPVDHRRSVVRPLTRSRLGQSTAQPACLLTAEVRLLHGGRVEDDPTGGVEAASSVVPDFPPDPAGPVPWAALPSHRPRYAGGYLRP